MGEDVTANVATIGPGPRPPHRRRARRARRSGARSTCRSPSSHALNEAQERQGLAPLRQPPQHRGGLAAPEGRQPSPPPANLALLELPAGRGRRAVPPSPPTTRPSSTSGRWASRSTRGSRCSRPRGGPPRTAGAGRSTGTTSTTRSTAWWSRSTTSPCATRSASRPRRPAGPSPTSSRPRSAPRG